MNKIAWYIFGVVSGFVGGVILGFAGWSFYFIPKLQEEQDTALEMAKSLGTDDAPLNAERLTDATPCPAVSAEKFVGV